MNPSPPADLNYISPPVAPGWFPRTFPGLSFYRAMWHVVRDASRLARRGAYDDDEWIKSSDRVIHAVEAVGARLAVENLAQFAHLPQPLVIVGNHMSTFETFALPSLLRPYLPFTFVVKRELVEMPVFKHIMLSRNPVVVGRANARDDLRVMLEEGEARLRAGISIAVFPQRTRAAVWKPSEFNSIAVKLARRVGVPVVPLALRTDVWGIGRWVKDLGRIQPKLPLRMAFGDPLTVTGNGRETHEAVVRFITGRLRSWGVPVVEEPAARAAD